MVELTFDLPEDRTLLEAVVEAVFLVHSYQEPVIRVREGRVARSRGRDDRDNPHRWWNTGGDWKRTARPARGPAAALALLAGTGGCATSRWVDERTPGDLWGTSGTEFGVVRLLRGAPGRDAARRDVAGEDEAALDLLIELALQGLSTL